VLLLKPRHSTCHSWGYSFLYPTSLPRFAEVSCRRRSRSCRLHRRRGNTRRRLNLGEVLGSALLPVTMCPTYVPDNGAKNGSPAFSEGVRTFVIFLGKALRNGGTRACSGTDGGMLRSMGCFILFFHRVFLIPFSFKSEHLNHDVLLSFKSQRKEQSSAS
jgi:hypothetical protein